MRVDRDALIRTNLGRSSEASVLRVGEDVGTEIDGFDDGDAISAWGGEWSVVTDTVAPGGTSTGALSVAEGIARLTGEVVEGFQWGAWSGLAITWDPNQKILIDATGYERRGRYV